MSTIDFVNDKINNEYLKLNKEELIKNLIFKKNIYL